MTLESTLPIRLVTDYQDYYDHLFTTNYEDAFVWERPYLDLTMSRKKKLEFLEENKWNVVPFGLAEEFVERLSPEMVLEHGEEIDVVTTFDEWSRDGKSKDKMNIFFAADLYPYVLVTLYIEPEEPGVSYRYLRVGKEDFLLSRQSVASWWNNCEAPWTMIKGDWNLTIGQQPITEEPPLFAVDLIKSKNDGEYYAIDYNTSPVLKGTGIEEVFSPDVIRFMIEEFYYTKLQY